MDTLGTYIKNMKSSASEEFKVAKYLLEGKKYSACLFYCHLCLEKLLKGLVAIETKQPAPFVHNLKTLAERAKLKLSEEQIIQLIDINEFNIAGRYQEYKDAHYRRSTKQYTEKYFYITKELFKWLKKQYPKK